MKCLLLILLITSFLFIPINANSAEPPILNVIVSFPPDDLKLSMEYHYDMEDVIVVEFQKVINFKEAYFRLFYYNVNKPKNSTLIVESSEKSYRLPLPANYLSTYNYLITLDFNNETISDGQTISRSITLVSMRVVLTLILEGLVLFIFGYRRKSSWILFIILNLITQGFLNITLNNVGINSFPIFLLLIFYELIIYLVETIVYGLLLKEHSKSRAFAFAFIANFASFILGGFLITLFSI